MVHGKGQPGAPPGNYLSGDGSASIRETTELIEDELLHPAAARSRLTKGRDRDEAEDDLSTAFQRDRDRVLHSKAFRRLKDKTQVFPHPRGDHFRTRLTHTLEVSQIARTIARALRLNDDLAEAIALGHDLGHPPFGHAGEEALRDVHDPDFHHSRQSLRVVERLEKKGRGLNLTREVRRGILVHSKGRGTITPPPMDPEAGDTLEAQVVRFSDIIAYVNHDLNDAVRAGLVDVDNIPFEIVTTFGRGQAERISSMVSDVIRTTSDCGLEEIRMSAAGLGGLETLRSFLDQTVYRAESLDEEFVVARGMLKALYLYYSDRPELLPQDLRNVTDPRQSVCDFIAGMTDGYAVETFRKTVDSA